VREQKEIESERERERGRERGREGERERQRERGGERQPFRVLKMAARENCGKLGAVSFGSKRRLTGLSVGTTEQSNHPHPIWLEADQQMNKRTGKELRRAAKIENQGDGRLEHTVSAPRIIIISEVNVTDDKPCP